MCKMKWKGLWLFLAAAVICLTLWCRSSGDAYSVGYDAQYFRQRELTDWTGQNTQPQTYVANGEGSVAVYTLRDGAISLSAGHYDVEFLYTGADEQTVLKMYASDYVSEDNSGGRVLILEKLDPAAEAFKGSFVLDQDANSVYISVETNAQDFAVGILRMKSQDKVCADTAFYCAAAVLCAVVLFWLSNASFGKIAPAEVLGRRISSRQVVLTGVFVAAVTALVASIPILQAGLIAGQDMPFHMARIEGIASGLASGQFPVRVHGETLNGFGYPNSYFYPELLLYLPAVLRLLGVHTVTCYKFYVIFLHVLTFAAAYFPFKKLFGSRMLGLALAVVYVLNPYRLICLYYRAAIGEASAIVFLPLVLYGMYAVLAGDEKDWPYLVTGATGLLQSHILSTELTALLCLVLVVVFIRPLLRSGKRIFALLKAGVYVVGLNMWFWYPMLMIAVSIRPAVFGRPQDLLGFTRYDAGHLFASGSLKLFGPHPVGWVALFALGLYLVYRIALAGDEKHTFPDVLAAVTLGGAVATTAWFPWNLILKIPVLGGLLSTIQFPYRLMSLVGVCAAALTGYTVLLWVKKRAHRLPACLIVVCVATAAACMLCEGAFLGDPDYPSKHYYASNLNNTLSVGQYEYLASGAEIGDIVDSSPQILCANEELRISEWKRGGTVMSFRYAMAESGEDLIVLPLTYIPNYEILVDGTPVQAQKADKCRVAFTAPAESGAVTVRYAEPTSFRAAELVSVAVLGAFVMREKLWRLLEPHLKKRMEKKR